MTRTDLSIRLRHLVALNEPEHGGPYQGTAAIQCMEAMTEAADTIEAERALADDLADLVINPLISGHPQEWVAWTDRRDAVLARWRAARA